jgi:hypothetical protein
MMQTPHNDWKTNKTLVKKHIKQDFRMPLIQLYLFMVYLMTSVAQTAEC